MKRVSFVALGIVAVLTVAACSGGSSLTGKTWQLTAITEKVPAFQGVVPADEQANYTIEFGTNDTFTAKADCNNLSGSYSTTSSNGLTIGPIATTLAACPEGSFSDQYVAGLGNAASYAIADDQLTITLTDGGTLTYK
jgi:heat shock protein HslJ